MVSEHCFGCLASFPTPATSIGTHPYIGATEACWSFFGEILDKEYSDSEYFKVHRITVDTYGAQHIGDQKDRRARQSANVHLTALYLTVVKKESLEEVVKFIKKATEIKRDWPPLVQRQNPQWLTIKDVSKAKDALSHANLVRQWGQSVCNAYADYYDNLLTIYQQFCSS